MNILKKFWEPKMISWDGSTVFLSRFWFLVCCDMEWCAEEKWIPASRSELLISALWCCFAYNNMQCHTASLLTEQLNILWGMCVVRHAVQRMKALCDYLLPSSGVLCQCTVLKNAQRTDQWPLARNNVQLTINSAGQLDQVTEPFQHIREKLQPEKKKTPQAFVQGPSTLPGVHSCKSELLCRFRDKQATELEFRQRSTYGWWHIFM